MRQTHALFAYALLNAFTTFAAVQPSLSIGMYNYAHLSQELMKSAASEAEHALRQINVRLVWVDCLSEAHPCAGAANRPDFLVVRLVAHALPTASAAALGVTSRSGDRATASVFCDRAFALRTHTVALPKLLGAALAHEVAHMLLPVGSHSESGLMRPEWSTDDLKPGHFAAAGLSPQNARLIHLEAVRRTAQ